MMLMMLAAGCVSVSPAAVCDGTAQARTDHAAALAQTADDAVALTGRGWWSCLTRGAANDDARPHAGRRPMRAVACRLCRA